MLYIALFTQTPLSTPSDQPPLRIHNPIFSLVFPQKTQNKTTPTNSFLSFPLSANTLLNLHHSSLFPRIFIPNFGLFFQWIIISYLIAAGFESDSGSDLCFNLFGNRRKGNCVWGLCCFCGGDGTEAHFSVCFGCWCWGGPWIKLWTSCWQMGWSECLFWGDYWTKDWTGAHQAAAWWQKQQCHLWWVSLLSKVIIWFLLLSSFQPLSFSC